MTTTGKFLLSLCAHLAVNFRGKFDEEIQQRAVSCLPQHGAPAFGKSVARMRFPRRRNHSPAKRAAIQSPLRTQFLLTFIVGKKVAHDGMPRPGPETVATTLIVTRFVVQRRVPQRGQAVGGNELS